MQNTVKVSIIIPTFNRGEMVVEAVESVLAQTHGRFELIVVDDGSTDDTSKRLGDWGSQITLIHQQNRGVSAARNTGIDAAGGDLIAFLDSDDLWLPGKLAAQIEFFSTRPDALICQTEEIWIRKGVRVNPKNKHKKPSGQIFNRSLELCLVSPSAVMMRRELFDRVGRFDESLPACEDYDLWLRITARFPVHLIDTPLIIKRGGHADQLSRQWGLDRYRIQSLAKLLVSGRLTPNQQSSALEVLKQKCRVYAGGCEKRGKTVEADHYRQLPGNLKKTHNL